MKIAVANQDKSSLANVSSASRDAQTRNFDTLISNVDIKIEANNKKLEELIEARKALLAKRPDDPESTLAEGMDVPKALPEPKRADEKGSLQSPWTSISVEISSSSEATQANHSASATDASVTVSTPGFWVFKDSSVTTTLSTSESSAEASAQMASCNVKVSFECMRVDISRNWLRTELFYDSELTCAKDAKYVGQFFIKDSQLK